MFWRFGFHAVSAIDSLLEKESATVDDLLEQEELIQECKSQNPKLIEFLCKPNNLSRLLTILLTTFEESSVAAKKKFSFLALEVLSCDILSIYETLITNHQLLVDFWTFLDRSAPLDDLQASFFTRVNIILLQRKPTQALDFYQSQPNTIDRISTHIGTSAITELVMKLITSEEPSEVTRAVDWLASNGLVLRLINLLDPKLDVQLHTTSCQTILDIISVSYQTFGPIELGITGVPVPERHLSHTLPSSRLILEMKSPELLNILIGFMLDRESPNSTSSLTHGISIIMELMRRYCSDVEQIEFQHQEYSQPQGRIQIPPPSIESIKTLSTSIADLLLCMAEKIPEFVKILLNPKDTNGPVNTVMGKLEPFGSERLKLCELFAEFIHLQYLFSSSPIFEGIVQYFDSSPSLNLDQRPLRVVDGLKLVMENMKNEKVFPICVDLFFRFKWNNFLHSVVYDMLAKLFNTFSITSSLIFDSIDISLSQKAMIDLRDSSKELILTIFNEGNLILKIIEAQADNDIEAAKPKGSRVGYMGHLTYISEETIKLLDKLGPDLGETIHQQVLSEEWISYVSGPLKLTRERDQKILGGFRPEPSNILPLMGLGANTYTDNSDSRSGPAPIPLDPAEDFILPDSDRGYRANHTNTSASWLKSSLEGDLDFDPREAIQSDSFFDNESKPSTNNSWTADFGSAFGTNEIAEAFQNVEISRSTKDEDWNDFSNGES